MRKHLMSWVSGARRWAKWYKGTNYAVSCKQLCCPETKEGSWRAANDWWLKKKAEIDAQEPESCPHPHQAVLNALAEKIDWASSHAPQEVPLLQAVAKEAETTPPDLDPPLEDIRDIYKRMTLFERLTNLVIPDNADPDTLQLLFGNRQLWQDRFERQPVAQILSDTTLEHWATKFLEMVRANTRKAGTYQNTAIQINAFINCPGVTTPRMPVARINEALWQDYFVQIALKKQKEELSPDVCKNRLLHAKRFIRYLWERKVIDLPRNLDSREFRLSVPARKVKVPALDVVRDCLKALEGDRLLKLYVLLMLNCGMYQTDISELREDEMDWQAGTITRKRSKTQHHADTPEVTYKLWDATLVLLKEHQSGGERVLVSERGTPLVDRMFDGDKPGKKDLIQLRWKRWNKTRRIPIQLKQFRKLGSSTLERHEVYGRYAQHYLGHSPRSVAERHYVVPSQELFDKAISWLGEQILASDGL